MKVEIKEREGKVYKVRIFICVARFDITEQFGKLNILASGKMSVYPCVANVIEIEAEPDLSLIHI